MAELDAENLSWPRRAARLIRRMCEAEVPVIEPDERIVFTRTTPDVPSLYSTEEWQSLTAGRIVHELGPINNICPDWGMVLSQGRLGRKQAALDTRAPRRRSRGPGVPGLRTGNHRRRARAGRSLPRGGRRSRA